MRRYLNLRFTEFDIYECEIIFNKIIAIYWYKLFPPSVLSDIRREEFLVRRRSQGRRVGIAEPEEEYIPVEVAPPKMQSFSIVWDLEMPENLMPALVKKIQDLISWVEEAESHLLTHQRRGWERWSQKTLRTPPMRRERRPLAQRNSLLFPASPRPVGPLRSPLTPLGFQCLSIFGGSTEERTRLRSSGSFWNSRKTCTCLISLLLILISFLLILSHHTGFFSTSSNFSSTNSNFFSTNFKPSYRFLFY